MEQRARLWPAAPSFGLHGAAHSRSSHFACLHTANPHGHPTRAAAPALMAKLAGRGALSMGCAAWPSCAFSESPLPPTLRGSAGVLWPSWPAMGQRARLWPASPFFRLHGAAQPRSNRFTPTHTANAPSHLPQRAASGGCVRAGRPWSRAPDFGPRPVSFGRAPNFGPLPPLWAARRGSAAQ